MHEPLERLSGVAQSERYSARHIIPQPLARGIYEAMKAAILALISISDAETAKADAGLDPRRRKTICLTPTDAAIGGIGRC